MNEIDRKIDMIKKRVDDGEYHFSDIDWLIEQLQIYREENQKLKSETSTMRSLYDVLHP